MLFAGWEEAELTFGAVPVPRNSPLTCAVGGLTAQTVNFRAAVAGRGTTWGRRGLSAPLQRTDQYGATGSLQPTRMSSATHKSLVPAQIIRMGSPQVHMDTIAPEHRAHKPGDCTSHAQDTRAPGSAACRCSYIHASKLHTPPHRHAPQTPARHIPVEEAHRLPGPTTCWNAPTRKGCPYTGEGVISMDAACTPAFHALV